MRFRSAVRLTGNHKGHGFGLCFANLLRGHRSTVATMQHYVAQRFMWRGPRDERKGTSLHSTKRHINLTRGCAEEGRLAHCGGADESLVFGHRRAFAAEFPTSGQAAIQPE